jgi:YD repeat-containing protein
MKSATRLFALVAATALIVPGAQAFAQSGSSQNTRQQQQEQTIARGQLVSVNPTNKMLTIRDTAGQSTEFKYNDDTKVTGAERGVAGLATMSGEQVTVHYMMQGSDKIATQIEVQPRQSQPGQNPRR